MVFLHLREKDTFTIVNKKKKFGWRTLSIKTKKEKTDLFLL